MTYPILTLLATFALMLAMALTLILKPKELRKFNSCAVVFAGFVGLIFYGLGYGTGIHSAGEMFIVAIQAVSDTISMFKGSDSYSSLMSSAPWFAERAWMQVFYWLAVLSAMYFTAAVVLGALGKRFIRFLRGKVIGWRREIVVFYPNNATQLKLAEKICKDNDIYPVFIGECQSDKMQEKIDNLGGIVWEDDQVDPEGQWLKKLGVDKTEQKVIKLFASGENDSKTKSFLEKVLKGMDHKDVNYMNVTMTVICEDEQEFSFLTGRQKDGYYLQADICSYKNMTAKMLVKTVAPWDLVTFDENGEANNAFSAMILGFGQVGQSVLCEFIRNSQFVGKKTKIQVIDKNYRDKAGAFLSIHKEMLAHYEIEFLEMDAFSESFFKLLHESRESINYIAICMGEDAKNQEVASQIRFFRNRKNSNYRKDMVIATCTKREIIFYDQPDLTISIPDPTDLWEGTLDAGAKEIHKVYVKGKAKSLYPNDLKKQEAFYEASWYENDYSNRLSCDASATFIPAMYKAAGIDAKEKNPKKVMTKILNENELLLEKLSQMEHIRWNAFSYSMGVVPMPMEEFKKRVDEALATIEEDVNSLEKEAFSLEEGEEALNRIQKACKYVRKELDPNGFGGLHTCLVDWDALDERWDVYYPLASTVAKAEYFYALLKWKAAGENTEKPKMEVLSDFKQLDINNIKNLMEEN
ncbi:MAG: hypothetical protein Q4E53_05075 [Eubacteriales bacterium]|nr:hypothetical protein [Eubacteriales bacterium]